MYWYQWFSIIGLLTGIFGLYYHYTRLKAAGNKPDHSSRETSLGPALRYAFTAAMSPAKKESAYLHLPTYITGLVYHLGSFLGILVFFIILLNINYLEKFSVFLTIFFLLTSTAGFAILLKRFLSAPLRHMSIADDYLSNLLVTFFQLATGLLLSGLLSPVYYYLLSGILCFYLPMGKLRHCLYFFAARYHLARFYGSRRVWPPPTTNTNS